MHLLVVEDDPRLGRLLLRLLREDRHVVELATTAEGATRPTAVLRSGPIALDEHKRLVTVADQPMSLTPRAFALLECFLRHPGQVLTRDNLLDAAWPAGVAVTPNTVDAYVHLLRERLGPQAGSCIQTERGVGYRLLEA